MELHIWVDTQAWSLALKRYPFNGLDWKNTPYFGKGQDFFFAVINAPYFQISRSRCCKENLETLDKLRRPIWYTFPPYFHKMHSIYRFHVCDQQKVPLYFPQIKALTMSNPHPPIFFAYLGIIMGDQLVQISRLMVWIAGHLPGIFHVLTTFVYLCVIVVMEFPQHDCDEHAFDIFDILFLHKSNILKIKSLTSSSIPWQHSNRTIRNSSISTDIKSKTFDWYVLSLSQLRLQQLHYQFQWLPLRLHMGQEEKPHHSELVIQ